MKPSFLPYLGASNPTIVIRSALGGSSTPGFQLSQLWVTEPVARTSWQKAATSIGSGLARPELYFSSRLSCQPVMHPRTYSLKKENLKPMTKDQLLSSQSLYSGVISDFIATFAQSQELVELFTVSGDLTGSINVQTTLPPLMQVLVCLHRSFTMLSKKVGSGQAGGGYLTVKHNLGEAPLVIGKSFTVAFEGQEFKATVARQPEVIGQKTGLNDAVRWHSEQAQSRYTENPRLAEMPTRRRYMGLYFFLEVQL